MISTHSWDAATMEQAISQLTSTRSAYASIIGFYGPVFVAQVEAAKKTSPETIQLDESMVAMKSEQGFSLIEPSAFTVDASAAVRLLSLICRIAVQSGEKLGLAGEALIRTMDNGEAMDGLFADCLDRKGRIEALADTMGVPQDMLALLLYLAIKPSIETGARQLAGRLTAGQENRSSCPICSSAPIIGELDAEGNQWMHCSLCWHRWPVKRLACLFCDNRNSDSLEYLYSDDEPEYRVNLCGGCLQYLKVVDIRKMVRRFYPPLEQVASLHLDMTATEKGFTHVIGAGTPNL